MKFTPAGEIDIFEHKPADWPDKAHFVDPHSVRRDQYDKLATLIAERAGERAIEAFLAENPEAFALLMTLFSTGHHASWIFPKRLIRPSSHLSNGLIPDYILAGANSDGVSWFVLELKGAEHNAFSRRAGRVCLSAEANQGICQLLSYIDASTRSQSYLRDTLGLSSFREPRGILLIGTDEESRDTEVREFKGAWNRMNGKLLIRSYNALLRQIESKLRDFHRF